MNYTEEKADRTRGEAINVARAGEFFTPCSAIIDLLSPRESKILAQETGGSAPK